MTGSGAAPAPAAPAVPAPMAVATPKTVLDLVNEAGAISRNIELLKTKPVSRSIYRQNSANNIQIKREIMVRLNKDGKRREYNWLRAVNTEAVLITGTGDQNIKPYKSCESILGPFPNGCFSFRGIAYNVCGNCHYNSEGKRYDYYITNTYLP